MTTNSTASMASTPAFFGSFRIAAMAPVNQDGCVVCVMCPVRADEQVFVTPLGPRGPNSLGRAVDAHRELHLDLPGLVPALHGHPAHAREPGHLLGVAQEREDENLFVGADGTHDTD